MAALALGAGVRMVEGTRFTGGFSAPTLHEGQLCASLMAGAALTLWLMLGHAPRDARRGGLWPAGVRPGQWLAQLLRAAYVASLGLLVLATLDHARYRAMAGADDTLGSPMVAFAACVLFLLAASALADVSRWKTLAPTTPTMPTGQSKPGAVHETWRLLAQAPVQGALQKAWRETSPETLQGARAWVPQGAWPGQTGLPWPAGLAALLAYGVPLLALLGPVGFDVDGLAWPIVALACALLGVCLASWLIEAGGARPVAAPGPADTAGATDEGRASGETTHGS